MRWKQAISGVALVVAVQVAWALPSSVMPAGQSEPTRAAKCSPLTFRFLPGEFNYCLGRKLWERGKYPQARQMFELAAGWGSKSAQNVLGVAYFNGEGLAQDRPLGLAWLALAAERNSPRRQALYASALRKVSADERVQAERLFQDMQGTYADSIAAAQAELHYRRQLHQFRSNPVYGNGTCVEGANYFANAGTAEDGTSKPSSCSFMSEERVVASLEAQYVYFFDGWKTEVSIQDLEQVKP